MTAPERTALQRRRALERANVVRSFRAQMKTELRRGVVVVADVLVEPPPLVESMRVWDLLIAAPKFGRVKVRRTLTLAGVSPSRTVGGLTERQRVELVGLVSR